VHQVVDSGIEVMVGDGVLGFIRKAELSRDRSEQRPDRFAVGEKVDARVVSIDKKTRKVTLSIKQREIQEEKQAMAEYGSSDSGASLGDILGAAISRAAQEKEAQDDATAEPKAKKAATAKKSTKAKKAAEDSAEAEDSAAAAEPEVPAEPEPTETKTAKKAKTTKKTPAKSAKSAKSAKAKKEASDEPETADADAAKADGEAAD
jgi:small subunit ribosomal protein S1